MISLTESAVEQISRLQKESGAEEKILRLSVEKGGCSGMEYGMSFDHPGVEDIVIDGPGLRFMVDPESFKFLQGSEVDYDDGLHGKGFEIKNPNAESTCGCGRSFN